MGRIVGAAIAAHYPGLMLPEEMRRARGDGRDTSLIAGFAELRNAGLRLRLQDHLR